MMPLRLYTGTCDPKTGIGHVVVTAEGREFALDPYLEVRRISTDGFAWGCLTAAATQLALAILVDCLGVERARPNYSAFKSFVIAELPMKGWTLTSIDIWKWFYLQGTRPSVGGSDGKDCSGK